MGIGVRLGGCSINVIRYIRYCVDYVSGLYSLCRGIEQGGGHMSREYSGNNKIAMIALCPYALL